MLEVDNLHAYYGTSCALQNVSLKVEDAGFLSVLGRTGWARPHCSGPSWD